MKNASTDKIKTRVIYLLFGALIGFFLGWFCAYSDCHYYVTQYQKTQRLLKLMSHWNPALRDAIEVAKSDNEKAWGKDISGCGHFCCPPSPDEIFKTMGNRSDEAVQDALAKWIAAQGYCSTNWVY